MAHEHGPHQCYCPSCGYEVTAEESVKCNTLVCPRCGTPLRASETGELRVTQAVSSVIPIDDQPIDATFFGEVRRLTDWITPDSLEVQSLYQHLTEGVIGSRDKIIACWNWVASQVKYVKFVKGKLWINGKASVQDDLWTLPETTIRTQVGNCAVKSFLLTSLLRNQLSAEEVYCALGNLYNGKPGGHAWINLNLDDGEFYMESTMPTAPPLVPVAAAKRYEAVHYFNDKKVLAVEGKTQLIPFTACYSDWLNEYLHWAYIEGQRR